MIHKVTKSYLQKQYDTSEIPVVETDLKDCFGYYHPDIVKLLIKDSLSNEDKLMIFYHEYKHYLQSRRYTECYIDSNYAKMEYQAQMYAGQMILKNKVIPSLFAWQNGIYNWLDGNDEHEYLYYIAEKIMQHKIWNKIERFLIRHGYNLNTSQKEKCLTKTRYCIKLSLDNSIEMAEESYRRIRKQLISDDDVIYEEAVKTQW